MHTETETNGANGAQNAVATVAQNGPRRPLAGRRNDERHAGKANGRPTNKTPQTGANAADSESDAKPPYGSPRGKRGGNQGVRLVTVLSYWRRLLRNGTLTGYEVRR